MAELVLPAGSVPVMQHTKTKPNTKTKRASTAPEPSTSVVASFRNALKGVKNLWQTWQDGMTEQERARSKALEEKRQILSARMRNAETRAQWDAAAIDLDALEGHDEWKRDSSTGDYNPQLIQERLQALDEARQNCDVRAMMHLLRTALSRDLGGMDNVDLYRHSYSGTKYLIQRYVDSTLQTIDAVVTQSQLGHGVEHRDLLEGILFARQSFGRSALLLSGGGTFGMCHIGVLKSLFEAQLLPRIISGASAGSIVCAAMCTCTDEEMPQLIKEFPYGDLAVFEDTRNPDGVLGNLRRLLTEGSWSDITHLRRVMHGLMGDMTFQEAYNRTRRILNICVSTESIYELPRLLNYVTAPNVMIWSAVAASCSAPLVFNASPLLVKDPLTGEHHPWNPTPQRWIDGSVDNDLPMTRLSEMFNVNHFIVSQVNPHVVPFLSKDDCLAPGQKLEPAGEGQESANDTDWMYTVTSLAKDEALHRLQFLAEVGFMPNLVTKLRSVLSQKYSGDINILPEISMQDLPRLFSNPSSEFMLRACLAGERATWPKLSRIRDRCAIELALDRAVHRLRTRVVFSESQRDLRQLHDAATRSLHLQLKPPPTRASGRPSSTYEGKGHRRLRRRSGGSLHVVPDKWVLLDHEITDEDTEQEERFEMQARRSATTSPAVNRKPRLKRASRSQIHIDTRSRHASYGLAEESARGIEFSNTLALRPKAKTLAAPAEIDPHDTNGDESGLVSPDPWSDNTGQSRDNIPSPTEDAELSDAGQSGRTDDTEGSEPGPYDDLRLKMNGVNGPFGSYSSIMGGAEERAGWVLWD